MRTSLSDRLTYRIMAVVMVMMAVIAGVVYYTVRTYMRDEAKERYLGLLLKNHQEVRRRLLKVSAAVENNVHDIERDIDYPERMDDHTKRMVRQNPSIVNCRLMSVPDSLQEQGLWLPAQKPRLVVTYAIPLHDSGGRAVAMLGADLSLEELRTSILQDIWEINDHYERGQRHQTYLFIVDRKGTYIIHPDSTRMLTKFENAVGQMMMKHRGTCLTEVDGVMSRLYYRGIPGTDWTMVIVTPKDVILSKAFHLNTIILLTMLIGLAVIYFLCRRQIKEIADPVATQNAILDRELKIANAIQMAMLPKKQEAGSRKQEAGSKRQEAGVEGNVTLYGSLTPAREVGGDLYDYFLRDGRLFFCIGDVSGKGIPAALVMAVAKALFRGEAHRADSAVAIVDAINHSFSEENSAGYFITMFVGILDLATGHLDYCNAGHEAPLLLNGEQFTVHRNLPVGALTDWTYEGQQTQLLPGSMLFLYTDGLSEAQNAAGQQLGRERIRELAAEHTTGGAQQLVTVMENEVHRHAAGASQNDDITLLAIKWQPDVEHLGPFVQQFAVYAGLSEREAKRLRLAAEEAITNAVNHGEASSVTLQTAVEEQKLVVTIDDDGLPFDPTADSPTDLSVPADKRPPGGMGIILIQKMADSLTYDRVNGHNILRIVKYINKPN